ncbi:hypothetical protein ABZ479_15730 [Streptomyces sp. NPDC005722]
MAGRIASVSRFRAEGVVAPWPQIARRHLQQFDRPADRERLKGRFAEVHLRWACSDVLGAPPGPFRVWARKPQRRPADVTVTATSHPLGVLLQWDGHSAVTMEVECTAVDSARAVALWGFRGPVGPLAAVGVVAANPTVGEGVSLSLRTGGMTHALLVNGRDPDVQVDHLRDVIDDDGWVEVERVGLPVDAGRWGATTYDAGPQGFLGAPRDPADAAVERLRRGGPPIGWWPLTEAGRIAPEWEPPDPAALVGEVRTVLLPQIEPLYAPGLPPFRQAALQPTLTVPPPEQDGRASRQPSQARTPLLGALLVAGTTDPFLALATGFGTAYPLDEREQFAGQDFMVTADYPDTPEGGPATYAAVVPWPSRHGDTAAVTGLSAAREGLVRPAARDEPWRETVRLRWDHVESSALLGRPSGVALARYATTGGTQAEPMTDKRDSGGRHTPVPTRAPSAPGAPPADHEVQVDIAATIPIGSGGRSAGYAVAVQDVFGVWSQWEDTRYAGDEPVASSPRVLAVRLDTAYKGSPLCPTTLEVHLALDWSTRTPTRLDVFAVLFPAPSTSAEPPPGVTPTGPPPAGCLRLDVSLPFSGDTPVPSSGVTVSCLDPKGEVEVPAGPAQSDDARRYRITATVPQLDFGSNQHWGVALWAREDIAVLGGPGPLSPNGGPARAYAATPVPPMLPPPPPLPGVPVGSSPDADGHSHVRVAWSTPAGEVSRFVVYEVAETALRTAAGLSPRAADGTVPGARLAALRTAYDGLAGAQRRALFRRVREAGAAAREADLTLPRGSTDIHLFGVTAVGPANVESPWPSDHTHLRAFMAPRILAPAAPTVTPSYGPVGTAMGVRLEVASTSAVPVDSFLLFRTRSPFAAQSAQTMGPPFADIEATKVTTDPPTPTGGPCYTSTWSGTLPESWEPWLVRAVAVPRRGVPVDAVVGTPSPGSATVPVQLPPSAPPDLSALVTDDWDGTGIVVSTNTTAPSSPTPLGPHLLSVSVEAAGTELFPRLESPLDALPLADPAGRPAGADNGPVLVRGPRASGRTPLAVWFRRSAVTDPVRVTVRLADPLGRVTVEAVEVPPGPLGTPPTLDILEAFELAGRGVFLRLRSDAPVVDGGAGPHLLSVVATPRRAPNGPLLPLPRPMSLTVPLPDVPTVVPDRPFFTRAPIQVARTNDQSPYMYELLVRTGAPLLVAVAVVAPDGLRTDRRTTVALG